MNETWRKPTIGTHGIFYTPSRTDTTGHTKTFDYPVMDPGGGCQSAPAEGRLGDLPPTWGGGGGGVVCANSPATSRPSSGDPRDDLQVCTNSIVVMSFVTLGILRTLISSVA